MRSYRFRFFRFGRRRRSVKVRSTSLLFKRFSSFEGLELRAMLTGSSLLADSALVSTPLTQDPYETSIAQFSLVNLLSSTLGGQDDAPSATPLAANATDEAFNSEPPVADPFVDGTLVHVTAAFEDLDGNSITEVQAGQDFQVKVFVNDIRTENGLHGVSSAVAALSYNTNLVSLVDPASLTIGDDFNGLFTTKDTSTAGKIVAGGVFLPSDPSELPSIGESQLLFTVKLRAISSGNATFDPAFDTTDVWQVFGLEEDLAAANVSMDSGSLTITALPTISVSDVSKIEGNTNSDLNFTVLLSEVSDSDVTVVYNTTAGTATAGTDFTSASGTITFEAGTTMKVIPITLIGDQIEENDETFNFILSDPTGATLSNSSAVGTILDDDAPLLNIQDVSASETDGVTTMVFTVTISKAANGEVTVEYNTADGTATVSNNDYDATSGTLTFGAGSTAAQFITVTINGDTVDETNETFQMLLSNPTGAELGDGTGVGTILNDDGPVVSLDPSTVSVTEQDVDTVMVFTVSLAEPNSEAVTVAYHTVDGAAIAGNDYTATSGTLTFSPGGATTQLVTVTILGDNLVEPNETFSLVLDSPTNATVATDTAVGTILNDDLPSITLEGPSSVNENSGPYVVTARLSSAVSDTVTVVWATSNGTAIGGSDYTAASGTVTFAAGQTTRLITVLLTGDDIVEPNETFKINLSDPANAELGQTDFTATIANDDQVPTVGVTAPAAQNEGNVGDTPFVFTVNLSKPSTETITVVYNTADAIATAGSDYAATSGTLTFNAGETTKMVTVMVHGDLVTEVTDETFRLILSSPSGATLDSSTSSATARIVNDDAIPSISISDAQVSEGDSGTTQMVFTVNLSNPSTQAVTVKYATQNGTATAGSDYTAKSGTLTFAPNQTTQLVTIDVIGDLLVEGNETFTVVLSEPDAGTLGDAGGVGKILDDATDNINVTPSTIVGKVFVDSNGNGVRNGLEKSLAGIQVKLTGAATKSTTTAADGSYVFGDLDPGTYTVTFVLPTQYRDGSAILGSEGGSKVTNGYTLTIDAPGGVAGTGYHFTTPGLKSQFVSLRMFMSSYLGDLTDGASQVGVSVYAVTTPITSSNAANTSVSGSGTVGATISVVATDGTNSTTAQTATVGDTGVWTISGINVQSLNDGTITYKVTATGSGTTDTASITANKDTAAPDVAVTTVSDPIIATNVTDTAISGTGTAGASISVVVTDGTHSTTAKTTTVGSGGTWSLGGIDVSSLNNGTITYNVTASDAVGNTKTVSKTSTKDTVAPALDVTAVTDPISSANEDSVTISGTSEAGATITVNIADSGSGAVGPLTTTVATDGTWSIADIDLTSLADGTITFTVVATDGSGNTTQTTDTATKDTIAEVAISSATNPINAANVADASISGTGEVGATISVVVSDGTNMVNAGTVVVAADGTWSITGIDLTDLSDAAVITYTATATDSLSNSGHVETTAVKDTVAPSLQIDSFTESINMENEDSVSIGGVGEVGAAISVTVTDGTNSVTADSVQVDSEGNWTVTGIDVSSLSDGTLTYHVTATDAVGNETTDDAVATKTTVAVSDLTDPITQANETEVAVSGTGQVGATVSVVAGDGTNSTTAVTQVIGQDGTWSVTIDVSSLDDATITFEVSATLNDHVSTTSATALKDTVADASILDFTDPINAANVASVALNGAVELDATVSVVATDGVLNTTPANAPAAAGIWAISGLDLSTLADGPITLQVTVTDTLGNVTVYEVTATKDTVVSLGISDVEAVGIANAHNLTVSGTTDPNAAITIVVTDGVDSTTEYTGTADESGNWSITGIDVGSLADGTLTFNVTAKDAFDNEITMTTTTVKNAVAIEEVSNPITQLNEDSVSISGTVEAGATVTIVARNGEQATSPVVADVDEQGNWTATIDVSGLDDGTITFEVSATDGTETVETSTTATKDTVADGAISLVTDAVNLDNLTTAGASGTSQAGSAVVVTISIGTDSVGPIAATVDENGNWTIEGVDLSTLPDGTITYLAQITDSQGNVSEYTVQATKDTMAPMLGESTTPPLNISNVPGYDILGTTESGASVAVSFSDGVNTITSNSTIADELGAWTISGTDLSSLIDGTITITVVATDSAGNTTTQVLERTKDTVAPEVDAQAIAPEQINFESATSVTVTGTGEVGATVSVSATVGSGTVESTATTVDNDGNWSVTLDVSTLEDGSITFTAIATDDLGNTNTDAITTEKDTVAEVSFHANLSTSVISSANESNFGIIGSREFMSSVSVSVTDGVTTLNADATEPTAFSWVAVMDLSSLADGPITITATATDLFGNVSTIQVDIEKDTVVGLSITDTPQGIDTNNQTNTTLGGTSDVGATVKVTATDGVNSTIVFSIVVGADGNWSIGGIDVSALNDGTITYSAEATDTAGNVAQDDVSVTKNTSAEPLTLIAGDGNSDTEDAEGDGDDWLLID